jgi:hypothetical protein
MSSLLQSAAALLLVAATALAADPPSSPIIIFSDVDEFNRVADEADGFPTQRYRSSDIAAPVFHVNALDPPAIDASPYLFIGSVYGKNKAGPMILDARDLSLVYADQRYANAYTSEVHAINGTRYLAFWEGGHTRGHASGYCHLYDENYNHVHKVTAQKLGGALADMHELSFTDDDTMVFSTYYSFKYDCSKVENGPSECLIMDSGFQEVDIVTNELIFDWKATDHFDYSDTYARYDKAYGVGPDSGFDYFHINSIRKSRDGNYLISARHMSSIALIDGTTGRPIWILGGRGNQFTDLSDGRATDIGWQHDARFYMGDESQITLFDNHGERTGSCDPGECQTRGLHIRIDTEAMTAELVREYFHPQGIDSGAMGGFETLPNGNALIGWGYNPGYTEYGPDGSPVLDMQRGKLGKNLADMFAYRISKGDWVGRPTWPPNMAFDAPDENTMNATVFVSWNGATDIAYWAIVSPSPF